MGRNSGGVRGGGGSFSQAEVENALFDYVNGYSSEMNGWLRSPADYTLTAESRQHIKVLDSILTGKVANEPLYRKTEAKSIFGYLSQSEYDNLWMHVVNGTANNGSKKAMLRINPNKRAKGMDLDKHSIGEEEVLLRRNTKYKVKRVYGKSGNIYVDVDIV